MGTAGFGCGRVLKAGEVRYVAIFLVYVLFMDRKDEGAGV
jgi:hypothetical protein